MIKCSETEQLNFNSVRQLPVDQDREPVACYADSRESIPHTDADHPLNSADISQIPA